MEIRTFWKFVDLTNHDIFTCGIGLCPQTGAIEYSKVIMPVDRSGYLLQTVLAVESVYVSRLQIGVGPIELRNDPTSHYNNIVTFLFIM